MDLNRVVRSDAADLSLTRSAAKRRTSSAWRRAGLPVPPWFCVTTAVFRDVAATALATSAATSRSSMRAIRSRRRDERRSERGHTRQGLSDAIVPRCTSASGHWRSNPRSWPSVRRRRTRIPPAHRLPGRWTASCSCPNRTSNGGCSTASRRVFRRARWPTGSSTEAARAGRRRHRAADDRQPGVGRALHRQPDDRRPGRNRRLRGHRRRRRRRRRSRRGRHLLRRCGHADAPRAASRSPQARRASSSMRRTAPGPPSSSVGEADALRERARRCAGRRELARLGGDVQTLFGAPQDVEWAIDGQRAALTCCRRGRSPRCERRARRSSTTPTSSRATRAGRCR